MLIRFAVNNLFSFKEETEFNLLPGKGKRLSHHKYNRSGIDILKLSALYGANGSGKSNLIKSIWLLQSLLTKGVIPNEFNTQKFRLLKHTADEPVELAIEFSAQESVYYYSVCINEGKVVEEYFSRINNSQDEEMIFERKQTDGMPSVAFFKKFVASEGYSTLKKIIEVDLLKPNKPLFTLLNTISNEHFSDIKIAFDWLENGLVIIFPFNKLNNLAHLLDSRSEFKNFANDLMVSLNTGVRNLKVEVADIQDFFGDDEQSYIDNITSQALNAPHKLILKTINGGDDEVVIVNENDKTVVKRLLLEHLGEKGQSVEFKISEESDGTKRLLDYLAVWGSFVNIDQTFVIDEVERSIHPLIIKELVNKFSKEEDTRGQLIFSTHESNLLDQDMLRTDEIWFAEKDMLGATKLYPLSDYKEHSTIDIQKGYLNGRYGAIPFLGNLQDLKWNVSHAD